MKKKVWILNHYAGDTFFEKGGRHYWFAKFLGLRGYSPVIFCCNNKHNPGTEDWLETNKLWEELYEKEIDSTNIFVRGRKYIGNGKQRILNMLDFYRNVKRVAKQYAKQVGPPDIIIASSVHPLTLIAGLQLAKQFKIKCICEVRDLWPESLVAYGIIKKNSFITKLLYWGEKWIYKKADKVIMTWPGGTDYITDKGWDRDIPKDKIVNIANGVDLKTYKENILRYPYNNLDFKEYSEKKIVYTGSIKKVNNLEIIVNAAEILKNRGIHNFRIFIFGDGEDRGYLEKYCKDNDLDNIKFMGRIPKLEIPSLLFQSDINLLHNSSTILDKYGQSQNKFFEYLASGNPILMTYSVGHSIVKEKKCGIELEKQNPESISDAIERMCDLSSEEVSEFRHNAELTIKEYDYEFLTTKLISVIEDL